MFRALSKSSLELQNIPVSDLGHLDLGELGKYCQIESWSASATTGLFSFGCLTTLKHSINSSSCGMLAFLNSYVAEDRDKIAELFDTICITDSLFSYCSTVIGEQDVKQSVIAMGESKVENVSEGIISGVFIFPHSHAESMPEFKQ